MTNDLERQMLAHPDQVRDILTRHPDLLPALVGVAEATTILGSHRGDPLSPQALDQLAAKYPDRFPRQLPGPTARVWVGASMEEFQAWRPKRMPKEPAQPAG
jgi:hypothetical protein